MPNQYIIHMYVNGVNLSLIGVSFKEGNKDFNKTP